MNKRTMLATLVLSAVAATSFATDNNFIGGTDNVVTNGAKSVGMVGYQNTVGGNNAVAFGENNVANGTNSFAGGNDSKAMGRNSFAYGSHAEATVEYTVAIGSQARTAAYDTIAIGNGAYANGESTVVIGRTNTVNAENATVIGSNNGTVESGHGVVVGYNNQVLDNSKEQLVFGSNSKTKGQGAIAIGTHTQSGAIDALAIGNNTLADNPNAVALGTNSTTSATIAGKTYNFAGDVADSTVSVGTTDKAGMGGVMNYKRTVTNVAAGRISDESTDAVNGSQLHATIQAINDLGGQLYDQEQTINQHSNTIAGNSVSINHLRSDVQDHEGRISVLEHAQQAVDNRINGMDQRMNRLGASSAALAGLHPLDFNADDKASYAVSYGHYRNANAVAVGAFYRPNERIMAGFGASLGAEPMYTANVAFKFGPGSDYIAEAKDKDARIARLERLVAELVADRNK